MPAAPATLISLNRRAACDMSLGYSPFARRYLGNHCCFLFLRVLRCFSSPRSPHTAMCSPHDDTALPVPGCPIRESPGLRLFAPNRRLSQLATPFIAFPCQGIHHTPFITWPKILLLQKRMETHVSLLLRFLLTYFYKIALAIKKLLLPVHPFVKEHPPRKAGWKPN